MELERPDEVLGVMVEVESKLCERVFKWGPRDDQLVCIGEADAVTDEGEVGADEEREPASSFPEHGISEGAMAEGELIEQRDEREERRVLFGEEPTEEAETTEGPSADARPS